MDHKIKKGFTLLEATIVISLLSFIIIYLMRFYSHTAKIIKMEDTKIEAYADEYEDICNLRCGKINLIDPATGKLTTIEIKDAEDKTLADAGKTLYHYKGTFLEYYHLD